MRILIAHDSQSFTNALQEKLPPDWQLCCCQDGLQVLEVLGQFQPDVLLLQACLPRKDCVTLLSQISPGPEIVVILADYLTPCIVQQLYGLGASDILMLPSVANVLDSIYRHLEQQPTVLAPSPVHRVLAGLGFRPDLTGYYQLCQALEILEHSPGSNLSSDVYPKICQDGRAAEKAIRGAIRAAWNCGEPALWQRYFPGAVRCPSNKVFLFALLQRRQESCA